MTAPQSTEEKTMQNDPRLCLARQQLRETLQGAGVFYPEIVAAKIEQLVSAHFLWLIENGMRVIKSDDN